MPQCAKTFNFSQGKDPDPPEGADEGKGKKNKVGEGQEEQGRGRKGREWKEWKGHQDGFAKSHHFAKAWPALLILIANSDLHCTLFRSDGTWVCTL